MLLAVADLRETDGVRVRLGIVPDEESEEEAERGGDLIVSEGFLGDFVITGEPTDMHVGVAAKGVVAMRDPGRRPRRARGDAVAGRERDPARDRRVPRDPVATVCVSELGAIRPAVDQPRPDPRRRRVEQGSRHLLHRRRRALPARAGARRDPRRGRGDPGRDDRLHLHAARRRWSTRESPFVRALCAATASHHDGEVTSVGRDGASDAVSFLRAGVPGGRVRPRRRRPPRPRRVGLGELAGELPAGARRLRRSLQHPPARGRRRRGRMRPTTRRASRTSPRSATAAPGDGDDAGEHESPPPATYAGRQRAEQRRGRGRPEPTRRARRARAGDRR